MKKIIFFSYLFIIFTSPLLALQNKPVYNFSGCNNQISENYFKQINKIKIKKIEIDIRNYRKWTENNIKILTVNSRFIPNNLKKNFKGDVRVLFEDNSECLFKARIRHSGDAKDHISLKDNSVIQSLDIRLKNGNIRGITKFKLFKPDVRGDIDDVVIQTQILRDFGYLAPRSIKVNARINQTESIMLFQEKASKELLEFNNRREGPILEGDQKFFFELVKKIPDNNLSNSSVGTPALRSKSSKVMLAKLTNSNLINKGKIHKEISIEAVNNLNLIYRYWSNRFQDEKNNFYFFDYDLDNRLLSLFDPKKIIKLDVYNFFLQSTNSHHGLSAPNRKFYWNSIENYFEPILYDANPNIDLDFSTTTSTKMRLPVSEYFNKSLDILRLKLSNIDIDELYIEIKLSGLNLSKEELHKKIKKINKNFKLIEKNLYKMSQKEIVLHNSFKPIKNILDIFNENLKDIDPDVLLILHKNGKFEKCEIYLKNCQFYNILDRDLANLLEGELKINNIQYQYIGENIDLDYLGFNKKYNSQKFQQSTIFYDDDVEIEKDLEKNILTINQKKAGSRAYIINGKLEDATIFFNGKNIILDKDINNTKLLPPNFPIDSKGLTGCLSLINVNVKNVNLFADNSSCEDAINFINSTGSINEISIKNSFSDSLDVDFSKIKFNSINISSAINDCVDFSAGSYEVVDLKLDKCGDKGISIGEKSNVQIGTININNSKIGIATKDSSILMLNNAILKNLKTCVSAYNKKQEFQGGFIKMKNFNCVNYINEFNIDNLSNVVLNNKKIKKNFN